LADNLRVDAVGSPIPPELGRNLFRAYAELLRRQRTASSALVRWSKITNRSHEFVWLDGQQRETLLRTGRPLAVDPDSPLFGSVQRMHATARLNPYEREVLYGYPYLIGRRSGRAIRAPLLTVPVRIDPQRDGFVVQPADDVARFNSLPFRAEEDAPVREDAIGRVLEVTPSFPVDEEALRAFVDVLGRELPWVGREARLDGRLDNPPSEPRSGDFLSLRDHAALFVAPKTNYFLASDLEKMAAHEVVDSGALGPLIIGAGDEASVDFDPKDVDSGAIYYPFPSNRSQRRVALLVDHPTTRAIRVEGPPGTGKSLTIANLACHLAATGRKVLITSQKDKALDVVDEMLRGLGLAELPMTLLRQDKESKRDLLSRLDRIKKERGKAEVIEEHQSVRGQFEHALAGAVELAGAYGPALVAEGQVELAHRHLQKARGLRRLGGSIGLRRATRSAQRTSPRTSDEIAADAAEHRDELREAAVRTLRLGAELGVASANRGERQQLRELAAVLRRDQRRFSNFSLFDRLKSHPDWAARLLRLLPVWVLTPDDTSRLFPPEAAVFDVVIVDEASQVDLPSIAPIIFRGKKVVVFGDTKQMQPRRFAFVSRQVAYQAWRHFEMHKLDPDGWLNPMEQSLLTLAAIRAEEENLLDEHFRSLPPIIEFSNERWYEDQLRVMTDERHKRFGGPEQPVIELHHVAGGEISNGSQENQNEGLALVDFLAGMVKNPDYAGASIGVICLFEEQVALIQDLVADRIAPEEWEEHDLVVVNPDGFQGDERDVVLYSLSWDNKVMPRQALSQRQRDHPHEQGMLNVAFTRGRDELHIFHSAPIETFTKADGSPGALTDWLKHCASVQVRGRPRPAGSRLGQVDSEFEAEVAAALRGHGLTVLHQYPACGFHIDLVCVEGNERVAVECDGWTHHIDEHGRMSMEDLERQAILERAGWRVLRIPYRKWMKDPDTQVARVLEAFRSDADRVEDRDDSDGSGESDKKNKDSAGTTVTVSLDEKAILDALHEGRIAERDILGRARELRGHGRLGKNIRNRLREAAEGLNHRALVVLEDGEIFLTPAGRSARLVIGVETSVSHRPAGSASRRTSSPRGRRTRASRGVCPCGGTWVLRTGRYGKFYGCSRYPRCHRTRSIRAG
jgi:very-short-patch-repair endonuclease